MQARYVLAVVVVAVMLGCGAPSGGGGSIPPLRTPTVTTVSRPTEASLMPMSAAPVNTPAMSVDPGLAQTVAVAVADLASRLARDESEIEIVDAKLVTWPDGSLGCPQPGMMYTQALVDGSQVILGIDNRTRIFAYHAGSDGQPFLCPSNEPDGGHDFVPPPGFDT